MNNRARHRPSSIQILAIGARDHLQGAACFCLGVHFSSPWTLDLPSPVRGLNRSVLMSLVSDVGQYALSGVLSMPQSHIDSLTSARTVRGLSTTTTTTTTIIGLSLQTSWNHRHFNPFQDLGTGLNTHTQTHIQLNSIPLVTHRTLKTPGRYILRSDRRMNRIAVSFHQRTVLVGQPKPAYNSFRNGGSLNAGH